MLCRNQPASFLSLQCEPQEGVRPIQEYRVNKRIKAKEVRLVDQEGEQIGIVSREDALEKADEANLDLVEVAPDASPPVCRLLDYGKFRYQQQKKEKQSQQRTQVKEVRIGLTTEEHDLNTKAKQIRRFLDDGDRVVISMRLSGREKAHEDMAMESLSEFGQRFTDIAKYEKKPHRDHPSRLSMMLAPM